MLSPSARREACNKKKSDMVAKNIKAISLSIAMRERRKDPHHAQDARKSRYTDEVIMKSFPAVSNLGSAECLLELTSEPRFSSNDDAADAAKQTKTIRTLNLMKSTKS